MDKREASVSERALVVAVVYGIVGAVWIFFSDEIAATLATDTARLTFFQTSKGWIFVAASSALIYILVRHFMRRAVASEAAHHRAESNLLMVFNHPAMRVFVKDEEGKYLLASEAFARLLGLTPGEIVNQTDESLFGIETAAALRQADRRAMHSPGITESQDVYPGAGTQRTVAVLRAHVTDESGRCVGVVGIAGEDVTSPELGTSVRQSLEHLVRRRSATLAAAVRDLHGRIAALHSEAAELRRRGERLEEERQSLEAEKHMLTADLLAAEQRLNTVVTHVQAIVAAIDQEGVVVLAEGKLLPEAGFRPGELVGRSVFELFGGRPEILAACRRALEGRSVAARLPVGRLDLDARIVPVRDAEGRVVGAVVVATEAEHPPNLADALRDDDFADRPPSGSPNAA
ncbi:MAG: PAS domain-containing protein [Phycisphaeraceae bacterium]|nr:PAS domain-containing protein [Phycisphaeraceae bacterium]